MIVISLERSVVLELTNLNLNFQHILTVIWRQLMKTDVTLCYASALLSYEGPLILE